MICYHWDHSLNLHVKDVLAVKSNRTVALTETERRNGEFLRVDQVSQLQIGTPFAGQSLFCGHCGLHQTGEGSAQNRQGQFRVKAALVLRQRRLVSIWLKLTCVRSAYIFI